MFLVALTSHSDSDLEQALHSLCWDIDNRMLARDGGSSNSNLIHRYNMYVP